MLRKWQLVSFALLALAAAAFVVGCSRNKSIDRDQARSEVRSALSFVAESEMFLNFVIQGRAPRHYAAEHTVYLEQAIGKSAKELTRAVPESHAKDSIDECQAGLSALARELSGIRTVIPVDDEKALAAALRRITAIRESLEKANAHR